MFTTMTLHSPLSAYSKILSMLHNYESRISSSVITPQIAFAAMKFEKTKPTFSSKKNGLIPTTITTSASINMLNKTSSFNTSFVQTKQALCTDEEVQENVQAAFKMFKSICQLCDKPGHIVYRCFKRFDTVFMHPPQENETKSIQQAMSVLQIDLVDIS